MSDRYPRLLVADKKGKIFEYPALEAVGMRAGLFCVLAASEIIKLPTGSRLFALPGRSPVGYDRPRKSFQGLDGFRPVAAFASPGYTLTHNTSYAERGKVKPLPLFAYGACALYKGDIYLAAVKVDNDKRHDSRLISRRLVGKNIAKFQKIFPGNRLIKHLAGCALSHSCPNAQNFFLHRYEGPLPTSPLCNASCAGCISYQEGKASCSQPRIKFVPSAREVAEAALFHIKNTTDPIVSFGQGCEGEPLLQAKLIEESIKIVRGATKKGTININTNGSKPRSLARLLDAGCEAVRISINSARDSYYTRYYRPKGYVFRDVIKSISLAKRLGALVSINYLTMPGFTDHTDEVAAIESLISKFRIDMIQWRNLNYDPMLYLRILKAPTPEISDLVGIRQEIALLKRKFPRLMTGYFNPRAAAFRRR